MTLERGRARCQSDDAIVFDSALDYHDPRWVWEPTLTKTAGLVQPYLAGSVGIVTTACVGGGSIVYAGATVAPVRRYFEKIFPAGLSYDELESVYRPRGFTRLAATPVPADLLGSAAFAHVRSAEAQLARVGLVAEPVRSTFDWDIVRRVFDHSGGSPAVEAKACSWNRDSAKKSVTRNYLRWAGQRPNWSLLTLRDVQHIAPGERQVRPRRRGAGPRRWRRNLYLQTPFRRRRGARDDPSAAAIAGARRVTRSHRAPRQDGRRHR